ncbi:hypothetical protein HB775_00900 [Rhizobium leguminosarum bv. trifolii]|nr:hypothetical protein HB775_00900 [Rhizobium leguminosarum bv. trifolii]
MTDRVFIGCHVPPALCAEIDAAVLRGVPGSSGYFASRSDYLRAAILRMQSELATPAVRQRQRVQPVAKQVTG